MLGEVIGEARGKRTGRRVLPDGKVEVSFEGKATLFGAEALELGTYWAEIRPDGTIYGEGQGILTTREGEAITWRGAGVGKFVGTGVAYRGAVYHYSAAPRFARLNSVASIFEFEADEAGNTQSKLWEWK